MRKAKRSTDNRCFFNHGLHGFTRIGFNRELRELYECAKRGWAFSSSVSLWATPTISVKGWAIIPLGRTGGRQIKTTDYTNSHGLFLSANYTNGTNAQGGAEHRWPLAFLNHGLHGLFLSANCNSVKPLVKIRVISGLRNLRFTFSSFWRGLSTTTLNRAYTFKRQRAVYFLSTNCTNETNSQSEDR